TRCSGSRSRRYRRRGRCDARFPSWRGRGPSGLRRRSRSSAAGGWRWAGGGAPGPPRRGPPRGARPRRALPPPRPRPPPAALGALAGGVWVPELSLVPAGRGLAWLGLLAVPLLPAAAEILFRGLVQGNLAGWFRIQRARGRWFLSWPAIASGLLYAPTGLALA